MKISIVIPVYNDVRISRSISSIIEQNYGGDIELIVVDGGSNDGTLDVVRDFGNEISTLISEPDQGIFDAFNKGLRLATGDVIGLIGADDRYVDGRVFEDVVSKLQDSGADACYGDLVYVDDDDRIVRYWRSGAYRRRNLYLGWIPPHFTLFARRQVYDQCGEFNIKFRVAADYDFQLRMLLSRKITMAYLERVLVSMTLGGNSNGSIKNVVRGNVESFLSWREHHLALGLLVPICKPARKLSQFRHRPPSHLIQENGSVK